MPKNPRIQYVGSQAKKAKSTSNEKSIHPLPDADQVKESQSEHAPKTPSIHQLPVQVTRTKHTRTGALPGAVHTPLDEEDSSQGYTPMITTSTGLTGRGLQAGFDGEIQAEKLLEKLIANLEENERSENATAVGAQVATVFPLKTPSHSMNALLDALKHPPAETAPFTEAGLNQEHSSLNIVPLELLQSIDGLKRRVGEMPHKQYLKTRNALFPECTSGSRQYRNRAGDKLEAVLEESGIAADIRCAAHQQFRFADVCGGPGAFSQMLFDWVPRQSKECTQMVGVGITLKAERKGPDSLAWYPHLLQGARGGQRFIPCWGADGTGDIYVARNMDAFVELCQHSQTTTSGLATDGLDLVVADGGFNLTGKEAFQEVLSGRLLLCETILALRTLKDGGSFVLKAFDTLTPFTVSLIYILTFCFETVQLCKPTRSRVVNSERYIVGRRLSAKKRSDSVFRAVLDQLQSVNKKLGKTTSNKIPHGILPTSALLEDYQYLASLRQPTVYWMTRQKYALEKILQNWEANTVSP
ncbi:methyltransferase [Perkinsela sp. CCAP 1560/4]|nr:methyltransferase [Perkinsela sp. CCAP 1560/4]|eukprot:KNH03873.1 methyltransferase [Perkinsela sp. CCAP 1560/4]